MADPIDLCEAVHDEATFIVFLSALRADFQQSQKTEVATPSSPYGPAAKGWENTTIDGFLDAATAWAHASPQKHERPWRRVANILYAGKIYE
jgi:hypothetical protein